MSTLNTTALNNLSKDDLVALLVRALGNEQVTQAPTEVDERPTCGRTKSSDGEPCTRKGTQDDGACKSHTGDWDNEAAAAKAAKADDFVTSLRERAQEREAQGKTSRSTNKALAAAIRAQGGTPNGDTWASAKAALTEGLTVEAAAEYATA